jgi:hypothetical protein
MCLHFSGITVQVVFSSHTKYQAAPVCTLRDSSTLRKFAKKKGRKFYMQGLIFTFQTIINTEKYSVFLDMIYDSLITLEWYLVCWIAQNSHATGLVERPKNRPSTPTMPGASLCHNMHDCGTVR